MNETPSDSGDSGDSLDIVRAKLEKMSEALSSVTFDLVNFGAKVAGLSSLTPSPSGATAALQGAPSASVASPSTGLLSVITQALAPVVASLAKIQQSLSTPARPAASLPPTPAGTAASSSPASSGAPSLGGVASSVASMAGPEIGAIVNVVAGAASALSTAIQAPISMFNSLAANLTPFVEALNPSGVLVFNQAMRDLNAVVGVAVQPLFNGLTQIAREVGSVLLPIMSKLAPIVSQVASALVDLTTTVVDFAAGIFNALVPVFSIVADAFSQLGKLVKSLGPALTFTAEVFGLLVNVAKLLYDAFTGFGFLTDIIDAISPVFQALYAVMTGVVEVISSFVKALSGLIGGWGILSSIAGVLKDAFGYIAKNAILAAAAFARFFGFGDSFIAGVTKALSGGEKKDAKGAAAAKDSTIGGLEDFGKTVTKGALLAGAGVEEKKPEGWLQEILGELKGLRGEQSKGFEAVVKASVLKAPAATPNENPFDRGKQLAADAAAGGKR